MVHLKRGFLSLVVVALLGVLLLPTQPAKAAVTYNVGCGGSRNSELAQAIASSNADGGDSIINLTSGCVFTLTNVHNSVSGENNALPIIGNNGTLTINGNGAIIERSTAGVPAFRLLYVGSGANVTINSLILQKGYTSTGAGIFTNAGTLTINDSIFRDNTGTNSGGGIYAAGSSTVTINNSTFANNRGGVVAGALIVNNSNTTVRNSTFYGNSAPQGGTIYLFSTTTVTLINSTLVGNSADSTGGGIWVAAGTLNLRNTIAANNTNGDCNRSSGTVSGSHNLIENGESCTAFLSSTVTIDPTLGELQTAPNGTQYYPLLENSPAIDAGSNTHASALTTDQAGQARFYDDTGFADTGSGSVPIVDIGAFERQSNSVPPTISILDVEQVEGTGAITDLFFTVSLSKPTGKSVTVDYFTNEGSADSDTDYTHVPLATLTFEPFETSKFVSISVSTDTTFEPHETLFVHLTNPTHATLDDHQALGSILNDDPEPTISANMVTLAEGNIGSTTDFPFTISLSNPSHLPVTVQYFTASGGAIAGSDFTAVPETTLTFEPGEISKQVSVSVTGDIAYEYNEGFLLYLIDPTNASTNGIPALGLITNDDSKPTITVNDLNRAEGGSGTQTGIPFTVLLSSPSYQTITVQFDTSDGTATIADSDYIPTGLTTLTFTPGQISRTVIVNITGDARHEAHETVNLNLSNATNASIVDNLGIGTIANDDTRPSIVVNNVSRAEGNSGTTNFPFEITLSHASYQTITVSFTTSNGTAIAGTDYTTRSGSISFAPGVTSRTVTVVGNGDTTVEANETFNFTLSNPTNASIADNLGIGTITNDDSAGLVAPLALSAFAASVNEGQSTTYTVALAAAPADLLGSDSLTVSLSFDAAYLSITPAMLTFDASNWNLPQTVTVLAVDDAQALQASISLPVLHTLTAGDVTLNGAPFGVTITDNDVAQIVPVAPELPQIEAVAPVMPDAPVQPAQPTEAVPLLPAGAATGSPVMFMWRGATGASSYSLHITTESGELVYEGTFSAAADCAGEICQALPDVALTAGTNYLWSIQADAQPRSFGMLFTYTPANFSPIVTP